MSRKPPVQEEPQIVPDAEEELVEETQPEADAPAEVPQSAPVHEGQSDVATFAPPPEEAEKEEGGES